MFSDENIACKCGCGYMIKDPNQVELMTKIFEAIKDRFGADGTVTSWCRCEDNNLAAGGVPNSYHVQGKATDFYADGVSIEELAAVASECGADGIGRYFESGFCHADSRGYQAGWDE